MLEALATMAKLEHRPVVIANHPSRSATDVGVYGLYDPAELRNWNDRAPEVATGMAGAPGHQAATLAPDGSIEATAARGAYARAPTILHAKKGEIASGGRHPRLDHSGIPA